MFISFLILFTPLFLAPLWSVQLIEMEISYQEEIIQMDNSAILAGRADRDAVNQLTQKNKKLQELHLQFHHALACSLIPATSKACRVFAQRIGQAMALLVGQMESRWRMSWVQTTEELTRHLSSNGRGFQLTRTIQVPVTWIKCKACHKSMRADLEKKRLITSIRSDLHPEIQIKFSAEQKPQNWTYRMWSES